MTRKKLLTTGSFALVLALVAGVFFAPAALAQGNPLAACDPSVQALVWAAQDAYGYDLNRTMAPASTSSDMSDMSGMDMGNDDAGDDDAAADDSGDDVEAEATEAASLTRFAKAATFIQQDPTEEPSDDAAEMDDAGDADDAAAAAPAPAMTVDCNAVRADAIAFIFAANGVTMGGGTTTAGPTFTVDGREIAADFEVLMSGPQEVPGPGDADGQGRAWVAVNGDTNTVCWSMQVAGIQLPASAAHIHTGAEGEAGPPVVPVTPPSLEGVSAGCAEAEPEIVQAILNNPSAHYLNVHTDEFPAGAIRGQLLGVGQ